jgi:GxxExxY protein
MNSLPPISVHSRSFAANLSVRIPLRAADYFSMTAPQRDSLNALFEEVVGAAYEVSNTLGTGFLEKVYERALAKELTLRGIPVRPQVPYQISYKGHAIAEYVADLVVDDRLLVEMKCVNALAKEHLAQCLNYLKASNLPLALLINFQHSKVVWQRVVYDF